MKKRLFCIILTLTFILSAVCVSGADEWSEEYYRAADSTGNLTNAQRDDLEAACLAFVERWHLDLALLALPHDKYEDLSISELAVEYYTDCGFGYGDDHDGFMMVFYTDTCEEVVVPIGAAKERVPEDYLNFIAKSAVTYQANYGNYGPMYATKKMLDDYLTEQENAGEQGAAASAAEEKDPTEGILEDTGAAASLLTPDPEQEEESLLDANGIPYPSLRMGENDKYPAWYPKNTYTFPEYHDDAASRVVDNADLLSSAEEATLQHRLFTIRQELDKDIVIYTDITDYGFDEMVYAADFYDYNGYGCGDDYEGVIIFVNMDPNDRGWWAVCTGKETKSLYTEDIANEIDDMLFDYMRAGNYYAGLSDWVENFRRLYLTGSPYTPDWFALMNDPSFERTHNADAPRIVDDAKLLTEEEITNLEGKAAQLSKKYDLDIVVHTARNEGSIERDKYSELYYYYNGYGFGDNYDGILLNVFKRPYHDPYTSLYASGTGRNKLTEVNADRLRSRCEDVLDDGEYYNAIDQWLDQTDHMLRTGRAPKSSSDWTFTIVLELLAGIVIGGISLARAKSRMFTPAVKEDADNYFIPGSLKIRKTGDVHTGTSTTKTYAPVRSDDSSSGGGSSGRSEYRSSFSGSSGRDHSGSGRRF